MRIDPHHDRPGRDWGREDAQSDRAEDGGGSRPSADVLPPASAGVGNRARHPFSIGNPHLYPSLRRGDWTPPDATFEAPVDDRALSVIVTVRDDREELAQLLEALAAQTIPPAEVVIVDGGSTDGTRELASEWHPDRFPVRLIDAP